MRAPWSDWPRSGPGCPLRGSVCRNTLTICKCIVLLLLFRLISQLSHFSSFFNSFLKILIVFALTLRGGSKKTAPICLSTLYPNLCRYIRSKSRSKEEAEVLLMENLPFSRPHYGSFPKNIFIWSNGAPLTFTCFWLRKSVLRNLRVFFWVFWY